MSSKVERRNLVATMDSCARLNAVGGTAKAASSVMRSCPYC